MTGSWQPERLASDGFRHGGDFSPDLTTSTVPYNDASPFDTECRLVARIRSGPINDSFKCKLHRPEPAAHSAGNLVRMLEARENAPKLSLLLTNRVRILPMRNYYSTDR